MEELTPPQSKKVTQNLPRKLINYASETIFCIILIFISPSSWAQEGFSKLLWHIFNCLKLFQTSDCLRVETLPFMFTILKNAMFKTWKFKQIWLRFIQTYLVNLYKDCPDSCTTLRWILFKTLPGSFKIFKDHFKLL